jgi:ketosteroid isomerase-like protein
MRHFSVALVALLVCASCRGSGRNAAVSAEPEVRKAHDQYVAAINSNRLDSWLGTLDDDVVYLVPNRPAIVGKESVGSWAAEYLDGNTTHWTKSVQDLVVSGDWAFARYTYSVSDTAVVRDTSVDGGGTANDSGWGFVVYHHGGDGAWRVARDGWGSERPAR